MQQSLLLALFLSAFLATSILSISCFVSAQYAGVTNICPTQTLQLTPLDIGQKSYFSFEANSLQEFEYRLVADDQKPLGLKELYDFDEGDSDGINFSCFVTSTTDDTTCPNQYIANGQSMPIFKKMKIAFGFQRCDHYNSTYHSQAMSLSVYYRPLVPFPVEATKAVQCNGLKKEEPATFCGNSAGRLVFSLVVVVCFVVMFLV